MPRKPLTYQRLVTIRLTNADLLAIAKAAKRARITAGEWMREALQRAAGTYTEKGSEPIPPR